MVVDRCTETQPHPAHHNPYALAVVDCPGVPMPRPVPSLADRIGRPGSIRPGQGEARTATQPDDEAAYQALTADLRQTRQHLVDAHVDRDQARAASNRYAVLIAASANATRLAEAEEELGLARQTVAAQAAQLRANGTLLVRLRDLDEQRDRAWAARDTVSASTNLRLPSHWTRRCGAEGCTGHPEGDPTDAQN
jgi:hypothetical protein